MKKKNCFHLLLDPIYKLIGLPKIQHLEAELQDRNRHIQQLTKQQKALYRVILKIRASLDLETIFRTATKETCKLLGVERVSVYRFSEDWGGEFVGDFEFTEISWDTEEALGRSTVWNDTYLQEHQGGRYRNNETVAVADVYQAGLSKCHIDILEQFHIRAYATVPIFIGQNLWGILAAYQHSSIHEWQPSEIEFLAQVATQLGFAMRQSEQLREMQQKAQYLAEASQQQQLLFNLIVDIRESLDLEILFKTTTKEVRKILWADRVGIFQFEANSNYCYGKFVSESVLPDYDSAIAIKIQDNCFGERFAVYYEQGRIQVIQDIYQANLRDCHIELLEQFQIRAQMIVPLMKGSSLWGLLCIHQCDRPREWTANEIQFVNQLAAQFSVALEHADLLTQTRLQANQLKEAFAALKEANLQLERLARLDGLTQVPNRRYFDEVLEKEWMRLRREQEFLSLILFDIDYFKHYNDFYGHQAGDECLITIAQAAQKVLKHPADLLARYGGEEFAVILPNTDLAGAIEVTKQIQAKILSLKIPHSESLTESKIVTISLGISSLIPLTDTLPQELISKADQALYKAKRQGRNCWVYADSESNKWV